MRLRPKARTRTRTSRPSGRGAGRGAVGLMKSAVAGTGAPGVSGRWTSEELVSQLILELISKGDLPTARIVLWSVMLASMKFAFNWEFVVRWRSRNQARFISPALG